MSTTASPCSSVKTNPHSLSKNDESALCFTVMADHATTFCNFQCPGREGCSTCESMRRSHWKYLVDLRVEPWASASLGPYQDCSGRQAPMLHHFVLHLLHDTSVLYQIEIPLLRLTIARSLEMNPMMVRATIHAENHPNNQSRRITTINPTDWTAPPPRLPMVTWRVVVELHAIPQVWNPIQLQIDVENTLGSMGYPGLQVVYVRDSSAHHTSRLMVLGAMPMLVAMLLAYMDSM
jgi:hypothetical protein